MTATELARELFLAEAQEEAACDRVGDAFRELQAAKDQLGQLEDAYSDARIEAEEARKTALRIKAQLKQLVMGDQ